MSKKRFELLTDAQWELIEPLLPEPKRRKDKRGPNRACLEGILWVLQTGAAWRFLPEQYPSPATCWRRLKHGKSKTHGSMGGGRRWARSTAKVCLKWEETFLDGSFAPAQKGGSAVGKTKHGKGTK